MSTVTKETTHPFDAARAAEEPEDRVGVTDVDGEEHGASNPLEAIVQTDGNDSTV